MRIYRIFVLFLGFLCFLNILKADSNLLLGIESSKILESKVSKNADSKDSKDSKLDSKKDSKTNSKEDSKKDLKEANSQIDSNNKIESSQTLLSLLPSNPLKKDDKNYQNSIEYLIDFIIKTNYYLREMDTLHFNDIAKEKCEAKYIESLQNLSIDSKDIKAKGYISKSDLEENKEDVLESIPLHIINNKKPILFNVQSNLQNTKRIESNINESSILHDDYANVMANITLNSLKAQKIFYTTFIKLRKQLDFFSTQQKVDEILSPVMKDLKALPTTFAIPKSVDKKQKDSIESALSDYLNELATYAEIISYLEMKPAELLPQNTLLNITMHWILEEVAEFIPVDYSNMMIAKIIVSLVIFLVLWAFRTLIAKLIIYLMDFIVHISKQEKELHKEIQKGILKPISLLLLAWSINVSIGILYYPSIEPEAVEKWFDIFYVINVAWLFIAIIKSYGAAFISTLAQKSDGFRREIINLIIKILYSVVGIIAILTILHKMGFNVSAIIASLGLGGLAVALAVKDMLANFFASVMLLLDNAFSQGDWIVCGNVEGTVVEIGLRKTTIRTFDNALLFVPNSELAGKAIRNWSRRKEGRRIRLDIGLDYGANSAMLKSCIEKITTMLTNHEEIVTDSNKTTPLDKDLSVRQDIISINDYLGYKSGMFIRINNLNDSSVRMLLECYTKKVGKADFLRVQEDVILKTMDIIRACNIKFASETQSVSIVKEV
ncbi:mechanosensitive ion channel [Helicobacter saguini]|uniref:Mechanosensitive ion channel n=1 Tax=Helicobacter saguini TaxID=1548018 RepID=A0A347W1S9_9HELI|nr:mechanosensitive ion channel domain-containing protein [Helicobacter saguini]MWV62923.1 mechanosensitive ion channel [Helicobacter saguini]MWV66407.1 mechanosensitive ion channel [Helicobacter saguini]MWV68758.1 mechanosensitive ion channel [Helicobacter saguini]MWV71688.1 mechanosensitive ion channel [Helicobacter saguini]TLD91872.1 mechanosensitive ion channel family protein [Helicobacter saguini]